MFLHFMLLVSAKNGHDCLKLIALLNVTNISVNKVVMMVNKFFSDYYYYYYYAGGGGGGDDDDDDDDDDPFSPLSPPPPHSIHSLLPCLYLPFEGYLATKTVHLSLSSSLYVSTFSGLPCNQASPAVPVSFHVSTLYSSPLDNIVTLVFL